MHPNRREVVGARRAALEGRRSPIVGYGEPDLEGSRKIEDPTRVLSGMGRPVRHLPERDDGRWHLVELTSRTLQGRYLLRPSSILVRRMIGIFARAQRLTGTIVHDLIVMSNHLHLLASVRDVAMQADFMAYAKRWITDEVQRLTGWRGRVWDQPYKSALVSEEELAQVRRLRYLYSQGVKENLVASPEDWPGVSTVAARLAGYREMEGEWVDYSAMTHARERGEEPDIRDYTRIETLVLSPLPVWEELGWEEYREHVRDLVREIREEAKARHRAAGTRPLGAERVRAVDPFDRPDSEPSRAPSPLFHAASRDEIVRLRNAYRRFLEAYRDASERYRDGERDVRFPRGCFLPPRRFGYGWHPPPL